MPGPARRGVLVFLAAAMGLAPAQAGAAVTITSPANGSTVSDTETTPVTATGTADPGQVDLTLKGQGLDDPESVPVDTGGDWKQDYQLDSGSYQLTACQGGVCATSAFTVRQQAGPGSAPSGPVAGFTAQAPRGGISDLLANRLELPVNCPLPCFIEVKASVDAKTAAAMMAPIWTHPQSVQRSPTQYAFGPGDHTIKLEAPPSAAFSHLNGVSPFPLFRTIPMRFDVTAKWQESSADPSHARVQSDLAWDRASHTTGRSPNGAITGLRQLQKVHRRDPYANFAITIAPLPHATTITLAGIYTLSGVNLGQGGGKVALLHRGHKVTRAEGEHGGRFVVRIPLRTRSGRALPKGPATRAYVYAQIWRQGQQRPADRAITFFTIS